jgi:two-component system, OmpR family, KDP operon response regulator KdpE
MTWPGKSGKSWTQNDKEQRKMSSGPKILVIDDDPAVLKVVRRALESAGFQVLEASNGKAALELMDEKPNLVLQDLVLKDIAGYDLVANLRARLEENPIPIIALSGYLAMPAEPWDTSAGFDAFLVKPLMPSELVETVKTWLSKFKAEEPSQD